MKRYFLIGIVLLAFLGCEDVIEVDTPSEPPRLSVDALIRIDTSASVTNAVIRLGLTSSFFDDTQVAEGARLSIRNPDYLPLGPSDGNLLTFTETAPGLYEASKNTSFFVGADILELSIDYNGERYIAFTPYVPAVPIDNLRQGEGELFSGEETEVLVSFTDNPDRDDFYLFDFDFGEYLVTEDEFYKGQAFEFSYFYDEGAKPGREIRISLLGVDEAFYNYMNRLIVQAGGDQGPFQTPAATVRGNIINVTGIDDLNTLDSSDARTNFALGYFAVCQTYSSSIVIE